jgi:translation initiation factor IF-2
LNIDGKKLVELCNKAGIQGKGSALASLEDDEVVKLRAFLDAGAAKQAVAPVSLVKTADVLSARSADTSLPPPPHRRVAAAGKPRPRVAAPTVAEHRPGGVTPTVVAKQRSELDIE